MKTDRQELEEKLDIIITTYNANKKLLNIVKDKVTSHGIAIGEFQSVWNKNKSLDLIDMPTLYLTTKYLYESTGESSIDPVTYFTNIEIEYLKSRKLRAEYVAGRFAAKEAVSKALGTGIRGFSFRDIQIDRNELGQPIVVLKGNAKIVAQKFGNYNLQLSISHAQDSAVAYAVLEV
jgi:phosphopantetheine--protein transferase-like protein